MPGLIRNGQEIFTGLEITNFQDDHRWLFHPEDGRKRRTNWVRSIIVHTTKGIPYKAFQPEQYIVKANPEKVNKDEAVAKFWSSSNKSSGAHLIVDTDGSILQIADLQTVAMYHARQMNEYSIGIEMYQRSDGGVYEQTLEATVDLIIELCNIFKIQNQFNVYTGNPIGRAIHQPERCVGVFGHRDCTEDRGFGDPGNIIFDMLEREWFKGFNFAANEDLAFWKNVQGKIGVLEDGIPGPQTVAALAEKKYSYGLYTFSPNNDSEERFTKSDLERLKKKITNYKEDIKDLCNEMLSVTADFEDDLKKILNFSR